MISTTPLAEYIDMLYNRLLIEMERCPYVVSWRVELRPPMPPFDTIGFVVMHAKTFTKVIENRAPFNAVEKGAEVGTEELETVVEYHIRKFTEALAQ